MSRTIQNGTACREALARLPGSTSTRFVSAGALSTRQTHRRISAANYC